MGSQSNAIKIAEDIFRELRLLPGTTEKEVARWIRYELKLAGAREAFRTIVASGVRSVKPHAFPTNKRLRSGEIVKVDMGALYMGYRSDITRTYFLGKPTIKQRKIYRLVLKAQLAAIKKVKAGVKARAVDRAARSVIERAGYGKNFIHSTGHGVGRKVHEPPKVSPKSEAILKAGQVITIEPGIYIRGWGGIRIEDMVRVTRTGCKILTRVPK
ncbi:aminopeptidase P family protein [Candidatus Saganbacteria bacterium]|nr:aminopeptidase P family protein [Candidatus Saganbacteria bacterium]